MIGTCGKCRERFASDRAFDKHRVIAEVYAVTATARGRVSRVANDAPAPRGGRIMSRGNERRRCLTVAEMRATGLELATEGAWRIPDARRNGAQLQPVAGLQPRTTVTPYPSATSPQYGAGNASPVEAVQAVAA